MRKHSLHKKVSRYGFFSGPHFPIFGMNTEIKVNIHIQSEYGKIRTSKTTIASWHFSRYLVFIIFLRYQKNVWVQSLSFTKLQTFSEISQNSQENTCPSNFIKKARPWHRCFPVNFAKFLRTPPVVASGKRDFVQ